MTCLAPEVCGHAEHDHGGHGDAYCEPSYGGRGLSETSVEPGDYGESGQHHEPEGERGHFLMLLDVTLRETLQMFDPLLGLFSRQVGRYSNHSRENQDDEPGTLDGFQLPDDSIGK